jgi:hypothetical protein
MNKPLFTCGALTAQPEHPSDWSVKVDSAIVESTTLGGTSLKDVMYRKYSYILKWEAMSKTDYQNLQALINYHNDTGTSINFVYTKWAESSVVREVVADLLERDRMMGSGSVTYYQTVTLTLKEKNSRI